MTQPKSKAHKTMKSKSTIDRRLKELRTLIDTSKDCYEVRIAYAMECAIRWATLKTTAWEKPVDTAKSLAKFLKQDLGFKP